MKIDKDIALYQLNRQKLNQQVQNKPKTEADEKAAYNKKLREACDGFEELFVHKLMQVMRDTTEKNTLLSGGRGEEIFQDMLDENYSKIITKSRALGLSDLIYDQTKKT